jgi:predicted Zn-dependent protease
MRLLDTGADVENLREERAKQQASYERKAGKAQRRAKRKKAAAATPAGAAASLEEGNVYLVPLDGFSARRARLLASQLQRRLRVRVQATAPQRAPRGAYNARRKQLVAERLTARLARSRLAADPSATVLGLTDKDMFIRAKFWNFAFSLRGGQVGVISSARMDPTFYGLPADDELALERLRKMAIKDVAILHFGDFERDDERSVLYGEILGTDDLDYVTEEIEPSESAAEARWIDRADAMCKPAISPNLWLAVSYAKESQARALRSLRAAFVHNRKFLARFERLPPAPNRRLHRRLLTGLRVGVAENRVYEARLAGGWSTAVFGQAVGAAMKRGFVLQSHALRLGSHWCGSLFNPLPPVPA